MTAPTQLGSKDIVMVVPLGVEKANRMGSPLDEDPGFGGQEDIGLTVAGDDDMAQLELAVGTDLDAATPRHHQRPVA
jgi:hypothetical protein